MSKNRIVQGLLLSGLAWCAAAPVSAQLVDISECRAVEDRLARFACFEDLIADLEATEAAPDTASAPPTRNPPPPQPVRPDEPAVQSPPPVRVAESAPATAVESFGREPDTNARVQGEGNDAALIDTVADVRQYMPNRLVVTLSSGQRWRQMLSRRYLLKKGDEVRIYPSGFGDAYRLSTERLGGYIQVERVE